MGESSKTVLMKSPVHRNALPHGFKLLWYTIDRVLGQGGFGITYLAHDRNLDQAVAIKEYLPIELSVREINSNVAPVSDKHDKQFKWGLERFIFEARTIAKFDHANIVGVLSVFEENNTAYMVMSYEEGESLHLLLERKQTLPEVQLKGIVMPILDGLRNVHQAGFVHRDIKPDNIIIRKDGSPVLLDFGSARRALSGRTRTLTSVVSPGYAPFEQYYAKSDQQGPWTDIYSLGATMYRAVVGVAPMDAISRGEGILKASHDTLVPATEVGKGRYSEIFLKAIDLAIEFRETDRPQDVDSWMRELKRSVLPEPRPEPTSQGEQLKAVSTSTTTGKVTRGVPTIKADSPPVARRRARERDGFPWKTLMLGLIVVAGAAAFWRFQLPAFEWLEANTDLLSQPTVEQQAPVTTEDDPAVVQQNLEQAERLRSLLSAAREAIAAQRLTSPADSNALLYYREALSIDPQNDSARRGIASLAGIVVKQASAAASVGELETAEQYLAAAMEINPEEPGISRVQAEIAGLKNQQRASADVGELLGKAQARLEAGRLLEPPDDSAYGLFQQVLVLEPENETAATGIIKVASLMVDAADSEFRGGNYADAEQFLIAAETIAPGLESISALRGRIEARRAQQAAAAKERKRNVEEVRQLLADAEADYEAGRLIQPTGTNAVERYLRLMELQPGNGRAKQGRVNVANSLKERATSASLQGEFDLAYLYLEKAESLLTKPENLELIRGERKLVDERKLARELAQERAARLAEEQRKLLESGGDTTN